MDSDIMLNAFQIPALPSLNDIHKRAHQYILQFEVVMHFNIPLYGKNNLHLQFWDLFSKI